MNNISPDYLPNPVIVYDSDWRIFSLNAPAISILGYSKAVELAGRPIKDILHESEQGVYETFLIDHKQWEGELINQEVRHVRRDGKCVSLYSQFGIIEGNQHPEEGRYIQSGFYKGDERVREQQLKKLNCLKILADNVPGLMMLLIGENHEIQCCVGSEKNLSAVDSESMVLEERLPEGITEIIKPLLEIAFEGTSVSREFNYGNDNYSVRLTPISDKRSIDTCVIILQNITENKIIENRLMVSKEAAESANRAKSVFIANMSHEIRTPLNAILGFTDQLRKTRLTKKQSAYLEVVSDSSHHLLSTIDEILVLSRIESGQTEVEEEPFSIGTIIDAVYDLFILRVEEKGLYFKISIDPTVRDVALLGDPSKMRQVLINLISNAIKYTDTGGVSLNCSVTSSSGEKLTIRFEVTDTGIGIEADDLKSIFQPFHQLDNSPGRSYFGSGLGLTISNGLLRSMGGKISVKSYPGKGSTFSFILTFKRSKKQLPEESHDKPKQPASITDQIRILFTDDDPVSRMLGKVILKQYKAKTVFASSGQEAIKKFKPGRFDIVLLDINMPGTSGVDVANHIRNIESKNKEFHHTRIIAMTANALRSYIKDYLKAGMDDFILKPFIERDLIEKIAIHCPDDGHVYPEPEGIVEPKSKNRDFNLDELLRITRGDKNYTLLMLDSFLDNGRIMLDQMQQSYNTGDYNSIAEAAHRLLPSVKQLGFKKTTSLLKRIEARYLNKSKIRKDPQMIEHALSDIESCIEKISSARDAIL